MEPPSGKASGRASREVAATTPAAAPVSPQQRSTATEDDEHGTPRSSAALTPRASQIIGRPAKHRVRHRKQRQGQTIFKGHPSWAIMNNIKLGMNYAVSETMKRTSDASRPLTIQDFQEEVKQTFPPEGSPQTMAHSSGLFTFRDQAPLAFRHLRERFGVTAEDYMLSICGDNALRELGTPGKSGAVFYLTEDGKYMIKTVSRKEARFLKRILPNYYFYVMRSEHTLLPRFFGARRPSALPPFRPSATRQPPPPPRRLLCLARARSPHRCLLSLSL